MRSKGVVVGGSSAGVIIAVVVVLFACAAGSAFIAEKKGRNPTGYTAMGFLFGIIGVIIAAAVPALEVDKGLGVQALVAIKAKDTWKWQPGRLTWNQQGLNFRYPNDDLLLFPSAEIISAKEVTDKAEAPIAPTEDRTVVEVLRDKGTSQVRYYFAIANKNSRIVSQLTNSFESTKKCPYGAELIKVEAIKCKHCGSDIGKESV